MSPRSQVYHKKSQSAHIEHLHDFLLDLTQVNRLLKFFSADAVPR